MAIVISRLRRYPVKSCRGSEVETLPIGRRGPELDRAWMVVHDRDHSMMTQRDVPRLALVDTWVGDLELMLSTPGMGHLRLPFAEAERGARILTNVHKDHGLEAVDQGDNAAVWLTDALEKPVRLVYMPESTRRPSRRDATGTVEVSFADGFPLLVISTQSLNELNRRLPGTLTMERFRPNIEVMGCEAPHEEDFWQEFTAGGVRMRGEKLCERCSITTVDPETGERGLGGEPLRTLGAYRSRQVATDGRVVKKVCFGMNVNHVGTGVLRVGNIVTVHSRWLEPPL